jgi:transposase
VQGVLQDDPLSGHLFVFRIRRGDRLKLLYCAGDGFALRYRRLREGTSRFPAPSEADASSVPVKARDLLALPEGVDLELVRRRAR